MVTDLASKKMAPGRFIALGFATVILIGTGLLLLPISHNDGVAVSLIDALFTSTSAVCVTGLIVVDTADTYSIFGRTVVALLIQIGGLGITAIGVGLIIMSGKKVGIRERLLAKEALNYGSLQGVLGLVKAVLITTLAFEFAGMVLSFFSFIRDYSFWDAVGISAFHSIAAFNNAGFDILGGLQNLIPYKDDVLLNLTTCGLIIFGGLGFFVILELLKYRSFRKLSLHSKVVLTVTPALLIGGTLLLKATENISWLSAFFFSTSARTAGFSTISLSEFSNAGLFALIILMFIGASPGSTGGGIKTTTFFVLICSVIGVSTNKSISAYKRRLPRELIITAFIIATLAISVVCVSTFVLCIFEPDRSFLSLLFEVVSAFGTVGLSTGITPDLCTASKAVIVLTMFIGRVGPLTVASLWFFKTVSRVQYAEGSLAVG